MYHWTPIYIHICPRLVLLGAVLGYVVLALLQVAIWAGNRW